MGGARARLPLRTPPPRALGAPRPRAASCAGRRSAGRARSARRLCVRWPLPRARSSVARSARRRRRGGCSEPALTRRRPSSPGLGLRKSAGQIWCSVDAWCQERYLAEKLYWQQVQAAKDEARERQAASDRSADEIKAFVVVTAQVLPHPSTPLFRSLSIAFALALALSRALSPVSLSFSLSRSLSLTHSLSMHCLQIGSSLSGTVFLVRFHLSLPMTQLREKVFLKTQFGSQGVTW